MHQQRILAGHREVSELGAQQIAPPRDTPKKAARPAAMPISAQLRSRAPSYLSTARPSHEVLAAHSAAGRKGRQKSKLTIGAIRPQPQPQRATLPHHRLPVRCTHAQPQCIGHPETDEQPCCNAAHHHHGCVLSRDSVSTVRHERQPGMEQHAPELLNDRAGHQLQLAEFPPSSGASGPRLPPAAIEKEELCNNWQDIL